MVDDQPTTDFRAGVDFNARPELRPLRDAPREKAQAVDVQPVGDAVVDGCMQAVIEQQDLCYASGRRIVFLICPNVFDNMQKCCLPEK